jgi:tetratricopeptide (TPR) repeat protein
MHDIESTAGSAEAAAVRKRLEEAAGLLDDILSRHPKVVETKLSRAQVAMRLGDTATLERHLKELRQTETSDPRVELLEAWLLESQGESGKAERLLHSLKTRLPQWAPAHLAYAKAAFDTGRPELALDALRTVTRLEPTDATARRLLAEQLLRGGFFAEAYKDARAYYEAHGGDPDAIRLFVDAATRTNERQAALEALKEAEEKHGSRPEVLIVLAAGYKMLGDDEKAMKLANQAATTKADTPQARLAGARALVVIGKADEAERVFLEELARNPNQPVVAHQLGRLYAGKGRLLDALGQFRTAVALDPRSEQYRLSLAQALLDNGDVEACGRALEKLPESNAAANLLRMQVRLFRGAPMEAEQVLDQLREGKRSGLPLALAYFNYGKMRQCIEICHVELENRPDDAHVLSLLGDAHVAMGQEEECIREWSKLLTAAPGRLSTYLRMAAVLGRTKPPEQVAQTLAAVPESQKDMVALAKGWLFAQRGEFQRAAFILSEVIGSAEASEYARGRAQLLRAACLAQTGDADGAIAELTKLADNAKWRSRALLAKTQIRIALRRYKPARAGLWQLASAAAGAKEVAILHHVVALYLGLGQAKEAMDVCEKVRQIEPDEVRSHLLTAGACAAAGELQEAAEWYRKALEKRPGSVAIHVALARALDSQGRLLEALEVLTKLTELKEAGRSAGLFEKGVTFARWGLQKQSAECFERLAALGYGGSPKLRLALGRALRRLGRREQARAVLSEIPPEAAEYTSAQAALAGLAPTPEEKLRILHALAQRERGGPLLSLYEMTVLMRAERHTQALELFKSFEKGEAGEDRVPAVAKYMAVHAMIRNGDVAGAAKLSREALEETALPRWRALAVLLTLEESPGEAAKLLPDLKDAGPGDVLLALVVAGRRNDAPAAGEWLEKIAQIEKDLREARRPSVLTTRDKVLAALIAGRGDEAQAYLDAVKGGSLVDRFAATELIASAKRPGAPAEAAALLRSLLAVRVGVPQLAKTWAMAALKSRPTCQWAAVALAELEPTSEEAREILEILRPRDCTAAMLIRAAMLMEERKYAEAAGAYSDVAMRHGSDPQIMMYQARATEKAGNLAKALELYKWIWERSKDPSAANNAAYVMSRLYPDDKQKLTEAQGLLDEALKAWPHLAAVRDTSGWIAHLMGKNDLACQQLRMVVRAMPEVPVVQYHLGAAEAAAGRYQLARWHLAAAVDLGERFKAEGRPLGREAAQAVQLAKDRLRRLPKSES